MAFAIKAEVNDPLADTFVFRELKTMYGGKSIPEGDTIFVFASDNQGGRGLVANGLVASARTIPKKPGGARPTPRVSITATRTAVAQGCLGRNELKPFSDWGDGRPETELNFKFYRQATKPPHNTHVAPTPLSRLRGTPAQGMWAVGGVAGRSDERRLVFVDRTCGAPAAW